MLVSLTDHQWTAVKTAKNWYTEAERGPSHLRGLHASELKYTDLSYLGRGQDFFCGGYAGTGKSTILPYVIDEMGLSFEQVAFCAPTGKAAKVMTAKLRDFGINRPATTIHKLIYMPKSERADAIKSELDAVSKHEEYAATDGMMGKRHYDQAVRDMSPKQIKDRILELTFELHRAMDNSKPAFSVRERDDFPESIRLIVVDEGSMVGLEVAQDLASFGIPIFIMGDPGQLPPVAADYGFNVDQPDAFLTEIHRQAADNPIIRLATDTRNGIDLKIGDYGDGVRIIDRRSDDATLDMDREAMVLCGTHRKKWQLTKKIRQALGYYESGPCEGEPLLCCRNNKAIQSMVNGSLWECMTETGNMIPGRASFDIRVRCMEDGDEFDIKVTQGLFEEHQARKRGAYTAPATAAFTANKTSVHMDFGHVLTTHKSQGSQWDEVVVHDESAAFRDDRYRWLYTAITRAAERLTIVQ